MLTSSPQIDQVKILHPSVHFNLNLLSAACKMLYSDWLTSSPETDLGGDVNLVHHPSYLKANDE